MTVYGRYDISTGFYQVGPEVAGGWGEGTIADTTVHPPVVHRLHYRFDGWLGDELLESFPCYIVTRGLAERLAESDLNGFELRPVEVSRSPMFEEQHPGRPLPPFKWLWVTGRAGAHDFGLAGGSRLVVSDRARDLLMGYELGQCAFEPWPR
jgi:hypothetical protein